MACDTCMESHDFLYSYQLHTTPTQVTSTNITPSPVEVSDVSNSGTGMEKTDITGSNSSSKTNGSDTTSCCELSRRKALVDQSVVGKQRAAGYFDEDWRSQLCSCPTCKVTWPYPNYSGIDYTITKSNSCIHLLAGDVWDQAVPVLAGPVWFPTSLREPCSDFPQFSRCSSGRPGHHGPGTPGGGHSS